MSTPAAKRRRLDASNTLAKPFKTPFKSPVKSQSTKTVSNDTLAPTTHTASARITSSVLADKNPKVSSLPNTFTIPAPRSHISKTFSSPTQAAKLNADPDVAPLLHNQRELEKQLREVKEHLDAAEQAEKIEADSWRRDPDGEIDAELVELIGKWKAASRQAAEELYGTVRNRVNRMGGPRAFKDMQKKREEFQNDWGQNKDMNNDGSDDEDDDGAAKEAAKRDLYAQYDIDPETENEKSQRPKVFDERPGEEDEFTMAMMLRTLNVDLDIVGYDREDQRWAD